MKNHFHQIQMQMSITNLKKIKPVHIAVISDMVMRKIYKLGVGTFSGKSFTQNELSRTKL